jgi:NitT/TauT family transport system ATP-binding protein
MFQQDALLPWKTVLDNIRLGLTFEGRKASDAADEARVWIERVGLAGFGGHYPYQLSGGMRKRVAMAQCWIVNPDMVLMDEPFSALDVHTRLRMEGEILGLWTGSGKTVVFVTHDLEEAIALSDRVIVLSAGPETRPLGEFTIDLPRPRDVAEIRMSPRFVELHEAIWHVLKSEVLKGYAQAKRA